MKVLNSDTMICQYLTYYAKLASLLYRSFIERANWLIGVLILKARSIHDFSEMAFEVYYLYVNCHI